MLCGWGVKQDGSFHVWIKVWVAFVIQHPVPGHGASITSPFNNAHHPNGIVVRLIRR